MAAIVGAARDEVAEFAGSARYDLVWYHPETAWFAAAGQPSGPAVVDIDEFPEILYQRDQLVSSRRADEQATAAVMEQWERCHREIAAQARYVVVCSPSDRDRLNVPNVAVIPNGYRDVPAALPPPGQGPPTMIYPGLYAHRPNLDAAYELALDILPRVREQIPDARLLLVGEHAGWLDQLASVPGVSVLGRVGRMAPYLRQSHVCPVPLRVGSGTRIKILEAFAYGVAVVSTVIGAEGLAVTDGCQLRIADAPEDFAAACATLLRDTALRLRMRERARAFFDARYGGQAISIRTREVAQAAVTGVDVRGLRAWPPEDKGGTR
jgi:glycosyltransferase involved in cell wall biosynthesis